VRAVAAATLPPALALSSASASPRMEAKIVAPRLFKEFAELGDSRSPRIAQPSSGGGATTMEVETLWRGMIFGAVAGDGVAKRFN
jgi:hypothetical protein